MRRKDRWRGPALLAVLIGFVFLGCSDPVEPVPDELFGVWEWVQSHGGIAGVTLTPQSEGYTFQLRITRPDRIQLERDGVAQVTTTFEMIRSDGSDFLRYHDPILGRTEHQLSMSMGELVLTDPCCDGFVHTWLPRLE